MLFLVLYICRTMNKRIERMIQELDQEELELQNQLREVREARMKLKSSLTTNPSAEVTGKSSWKNLIQNAVLTLGGKATAKQIGVFIAKETNQEYDSIIPTIRNTISSENDVFVKTQEKEGKGFYYKLKKVS